MTAHAASSPASSFVVAADHPALAGHFPGDPIVPGVVILERVIEAAGRWLGRPVAVEGLPQVKFVAPLRPGERADVTLRLEGSTLAYSVMRDDVLVSRGSLRLRATTAP